MYELDARSKPAAILSIGRRADRPIPAFLPDATSINLVSIAEKASRKAPDPTTLQPERAKLTRGASLVVLHKPQVLRERRAGTPRLTCFQVVIRNLNCYPQ